MKIIYCIACTSHSGGMERVLANKVNYLARHGYEIVVVTTDQRGAQPFFLLESGIRNIDLGINYDENNDKSFLNKLLHYPLKQYRHKKRLKAVLMEERPDVTVSMFNNDAGFILLPNGKRYTLVVFVKHSKLSFEATERVIADISAVVFRTLH